MRGKKAAHRLYRTALYLYPKSYRREYGGQMVQTLQDMLDNAGNTLERTMVRLRVVAEMPLSVVRENSHNIGDKSMNKLATISNKRLLIGGILVAAVILVTALGVWRNYIAGGFANMLYGHSLRSLTVSQESKLADPFVRLTGSNPKMTSACTVWRNGALQMQIGCGTMTLAYATLGQSATAKANMLQSVEAITAALKTEGYQGGSNGVTLTSLVMGTYEGKDYSPDAFYQKTIGKNTCTFDVTVAYSKPAAPAINATFSCERTLNPFGVSATQLLEMRK